MININKTSKNDVHQGVLLGKTLKRTRVLNTQVDILLQTAHL